jgi:IS1 family transposase
MQCPRCDSTHIRKNGKQKGKQNHICADCQRQFFEQHEPKGYSNLVKEECLKMYCNGMGFRAIERVKGVHHTTIICWVKQIGEQLADAPALAEIPEVTELDELQTFVGSKKKRIWVWTAVNHFAKGIWAWTTGERTAVTFERLWKQVKTWQSYFYVTDGYTVYPLFINAEDQIVSKTYMTRVEGENTRLRHYLARLHRKTLCYSKSEKMLKYSIRLLLHYLHSGTIALLA